MDPSSGRTFEGSGYHPQTNLEILTAKSCNLVHFGDIKHLNNGNAVPMRSGGFSTLGTAFPRVLPQNDPWTASTVLFSTLKRDFFSNSIAN